MYESEWKDFICLPTSLRSKSAKLTTAYAPSEYSGIKDARSRQYDGQNSLPLNMLFSASYLVQ